MLRLVNSQEKNKQLHLVTKESNKFSQELGHEVQNDEDIIPTVIAQNTKQTAKEIGQKQIEKKWEENPFTDSS